MKLDDLIERLSQGLAVRGRIYALGTRSDESDAVTDYAWVGFRMDEVAAFRVDGLLDIGSAAALFAERDAE